MSVAPRVAVILAAAGSGSRFARAADGSSGGGGGGGGATKVEALLGGRPVFAWSLRLLRARPEVVAVVVAVDPARREAFAARWAEELGGPGAPTTLVAGGPDRDATVRLALNAVPADATHVAVHDAARPAVTDALLDRLLAAAAAGRPAAFPGVPVVDTLRRVGPGGDAGRTVPREGLVAVQTPQLFEVGVLRRAHAAEAAGVTDDAGRVAAAGVPVRCVPGDPANRKLTVREDLVVLERTLLRGAT